MCRQIKANQNGKDAMNRNKRNKTHKKKNGKI